MTPREINALFICKHDLRNGIDPLLIASELIGHSWLPHSVNSELIGMFHRGLERECMNEFLISNIPCNVNLYNFVRVLDDCGYRKLATHLYLTFITGRVRFVYKSTSGQRPTVHKFFRNLKRMVHDAQFKDPRLTLRRLASRFVHLMQNESDPIWRQHLADKCVEIIGAEIDAIAITFDKHLHEHDVFAQMKQLVSETSNTSITDVVYFGRLANANSIAGNFQHSENMLTMARCRAYNTGPCLELVNMLYIEVYVKLWEFEKRPTEGIRQQLLMWGRIGLESLEEEDADTKTLWRRMFILRMVFCLLGIGNRANMIENCPVDDSCLSQARNLLSDIDRAWYGIETRRKMFYYVAKARLFELSGKLSECIECIKVARDLAIEGHFEELAFIVTYHERMVQKMDGTTILLENTSRNFVLLRPNTSSYSNATDQICILAAADTEEKFLLLKSTPGTSFTLENSYNVSAVSGSGQNISGRDFCFLSQTNSYIPIACDEETQIILLKYISTEETNDPKSTLISERFQDPNKSESLNMLSLKLDQHTGQTHVKPDQHTGQTNVKTDQHTRQTHVKTDQHTGQTHVTTDKHTGQTHVKTDQHTEHTHVTLDQHTEQSYVSRNIALIRTSHDGSILPLNMTGKEDANSLNIMFLKFVSTEYQTEFNHHLVLSDLHNSSQNLVVLVTNSHDTSAFDNIDIPVCQHFSLEGKYLSLKHKSLHDTTHQASGLSSFLRHIVSHNSRTESLKTLRSYTDCVFQCTSSYSSIKQFHILHTEESSTTQLKQFSSNGDLETSPKVIAVRRPSENNAYSVGGPASKQLATETFIYDRLEFLKGGSDQQEILDENCVATATYSNNQPRDESPGIENLWQTPDLSTPYFNLIPTTAMQQLPRVFVVQPQEEDVTTRQLDDRSSPSGCSEDQILPAIQNTADSEDCVFYTNQRINITNASETRIEYSRSQYLVSSQNFNLIPTEALQELQRYFVVPLDSVQGVPTEDRSEPSGCSSDNIQQCFSSSNESTESNDSVLLDINEDQDGTDKQKSSFQSDDMFGD